MARVYVDRETGKYYWKNSRPCNVCIHFMRMYGIKKVVYSLTSDEPTNTPDYRSVNVDVLAQEPMYISQGSKYLYRTQQEQLLKPVPSPAPSDAPTEQDKLFHLRYRRRKTRSRWDKYS